MRLKKDTNKESLLFFISNNIKIHMLRNLRSSPFRDCQNLSYFLFYKSNRQTGRFNFPIKGENVVIINRNTQDTKAIFDYVKLCRYLDSDILNMYNN